MVIYWDEFDANGLQGMEAFVNDNFSIHVVKYEFGEGFHWIARQWDEFGKCHVTGSYDFPETQDGWNRLTDAYLSAIDYMREIGILSQSDSADAKKPSAIRAFLQRALQIGFATLVSISTLAGAASPVIAYADESTPNANDIYVEMDDGCVGIYASSGFSADTSDMYFLNYETNGFTEIQPGTDFYNAVIGEYSNGYSDSYYSLEGLVGYVEGSDDIQVVINDDKLPADSPIEFSHQALKDVYSQYFNDGVMHRVQMSYYKGGDGGLMDIGSAWAADALGQQYATDYDGPSSSTESSGVPILGILMFGASIALLFGGLSAQSTGAMIAGTTGLVLMFII